MDGWTLIHVALFRRSRPTFDLLAGEPRVALLQRTLVAAEADVDDTLPRNASRIPSP